MATRSEEDVKRKALRRSALSSPAVPKLQKVDLAELRAFTRYGLDYTVKARDDIKSKHGELYAEVKGCIGV